MREKRKTLDKKEENLKFKKIAKKEKWQERGITLIALVVTIIILLILAGVTLNIALSDGGLFSKVKKAAEETKKASDEENIKLKMLSMQLEGKGTELGIALYSKNFNNSNKWHLIIEEGNSEPYGTGWRYIKKGENLGENVISEYSWLLNTITGEMKKLEEGKYTELSVDSSLGTKEGLIFNLDPSVIEGNEDKSISELRNILGNNVELYGFDDMDGSGLTRSSFNFDGNNDWIKVKYDDEDKKDEMIENGFTFEFYGDANQGNIYNGESLQSTSGSGGFGWYNGEESSHALLHFQLWRDERNVSLVWSPFPKHREYNAIPLEMSDGKCWRVGPERGRF